MIIEQCHIPEAFSLVFSNKLIICFHYSSHTNTEEGKRTLTNTGDKIIELFFRDKRVVQVTKIHLQHACYRVNIMVVLFIGQWVVSWKTDNMMVNHFIYRNQRSSRWHLVERHAKENGLHCGLSNRCFPCLLLAWLLF